MNVPKRSMIPRQPFVLAELEKLGKVLSEVDVSCSKSELEKRVVQALESNSITKKMIEQRGFRSVRDQLRDDGGGKRPGRKDVARPGRGITFFLNWMGVQTVTSIRCTLSRLHGRLP